MNVKKQIVIPIETGDIVDKITPGEFASLLNGLASRMAEEGSVRYDFTEQIINGLNPSAQRFLQMLALVFVGSQLGGGKK